MKKIYLASPYSHSDPVIREARNLSVCKKAGELMRIGFIVYSPIAHMHPVAQVCDMPKDWAFWKQFDEAFIEWADELWVLMLPGWETSTGIKEETLIADKLGREVRYLMLGDRVYVEEKTITQS